MCCKVIVSQGLITLICRNEGMSCKVYCFSRSSPCLSRWKWQETVWFVFRSSFSGNANNQSLYWLGVIWSFTHKPDLSIQNLFYQSKIPKVCFLKLDYPIHTNHITSYPIISYPSNITKRGQIFNLKNIGGIWETLLMGISQLGPKILYKNFVDTQ